MSAPAQVQAATIDKFIAGWKNSSPKDMLATWSDDATQQALPFSLGHASRSRAQVEATLPRLMQILTNYKLTIHDVVHDAAKGKAVIYAISRADTPFGVEWTNEYAAFVTLDESRERIVRLEEMVDSAFMKAFYPIFQKYLSEEASQASKPE